MACRILVVQPGIEPGPEAVDRPSPNRWTAREPPCRDIFWCDFSGGVENDENTALKTRSTHLLAHLGIEVGLLGSVYRGVIRKKEHQGILDKSNGPGSWE